MFLYCSVAAAFLAFRVLHSQTGSRRSDASLYPTISVVYSGKQCLDAECGEMIRNGRHQVSVAGQQRVLRQQVKIGRAIYQNVVIFIFDLLQRLAKKTTTA